MLKHKQNEIMKDDTIYDIREKEYYVKGELL